MTSPCKTQVNASCHNKSVRIGRSAWLREKSPESRCTPRSGFVNIFSMNPPNDVSTSSSESVTEWLGKLKAGDLLVGQQLWQRYVHQLLRLSNRKLGDASRKVSDEEDVALSAFHALLVGAAEGRFGQLEDRDDLWQLLVMLTERKAIAVRRKEQTEKRGNGNVKGESAMEGPDGSGFGGMAQVVSAEPTPEFAAQMAEDLAVRLAMLDEDPKLRQIAYDKMGGFTNSEIAQRMDCSVRSVERQLSLIRKIWTEAEFT